MVAIWKNASVQRQGSGLREGGWKDGAGTKWLSLVWALSVALMCISWPARAAQTAEPPGPNGLVEGASSLEEGVGTSTETHSETHSEASESTGDVNLDPADETELAARRAQQQRQVERNLESVRRNIWWNRQRVINSLKLEDEQRRTLDGLLEDYLRTVLQAEPNTEASLAFHQALAGGELESARGHLETIGAEARERGMAEGEMMLQVLSQLSPEQLETLRQRHGLLLQRSWVKWVSSSRGRTGGRPGGHGARAGSGSGRGSGGGG